ncbi:MAG: patatin-like phospholipase family protein [Gammaproteobacteria bacterium]|nr:patatin-like phospholipase family protein [Gammaproteobacteria bacterium]
MKKSSNIQVLAGKRAYSYIQQHDIQADDISMLVGASGGPKWFCLFGLDQYLTSTFFKGRQAPLELIGSSAGSWRFACYAQQDAAAASRRFCDAYRTISYPKGSSIAKVTEISATVLDAVFPTTGNVQEVIENPIFRLNFVVARPKRWLHTEKNLAQLAGLTLAAGANLVHRRSLAAFYERLIFQQQPEQSVFSAIRDLPTRHIKLSPDNLKQALLASGSIPLVLDPVNYIDGAGDGPFIDGGITDYHFDWPFPTSGLVLYPHFYPKVSPGWFDKGLKWRRPGAGNYDNVIMLCPSESWVKSLPFGKIPDRKDFSQLTDEKRFQYWQEVTERSFELAEDFASGNYKIERLAWD